MNTSSLPKHQHIIADLIPPDAKVLDIGCADGALLGWLHTHKNVRAQGIEIDKSKVQSAISRGISVVQDNAEDTISHYRDHSYDYVILSQTLQMMQDPKMMLSEAARISEHVIASVPNFGHWHNRLYLAWHGRMPVTKQLDYQWYETPNIHFCTMRDFVILAQELDLIIEKRVILTSKLIPAWLSAKPWVSNLFGRKGVFLLRKKAK